MRFTGGGWVMDPVGGGKPRPLPPGAQPKT
jgi:hypothetical protein